MQKQFIAKVFEEATGFSAPIICLNLKGVILSASDKGIKLLSDISAKIVGRQLNEFCLGYDAKLMDLAIATLLEEKHHEAFRSKLVHQNGAVVSASVKLFLIEMSDPDQHAILATFLRIAPEENNGNDAFAQSTKLALH